MKLSDYIAEFLSKITDSVFVGQGGNIIHVLDSLGKRKDIKVIPSQNEQGASIAADAYSRFNNKIGVTAATSGPGMLNLMQGMACSFFDSIPTFHFSGAVVTGQLRKNKKIRQIGFQEMEVVDLVKPITKYAVLLTDPETGRRIPPTRTRPVESSTFLPFQGGGKRRHSFHLFFRACGVEIEDRVGWSGTSVSDKACLRTTRSLQ